VLPPICARHDWKKGGLCSSGKALAPTEAFAGPFKGHYADTGAARDGDSYRTLANLFHVSLAIPCFEHERHDLVEMQALQVFCRGHDGQQLASLRILELQSTWGLVDRHHLANVPIETNQRAGPERRRPHPDHQYDHDNPDGGFFTMRGSPSRPIRSASRTNRSRKSLS
jgi:hypothetical protein